MKIYTVYRNPKDFPGKIVVRGFTIDGTPEPKADPAPVFVAPDIPESMAAARRAIRDSGHFLRVDRQANDDPVIVEVWL